MLLSAFASEYGTISLKCGLRLWCNLNSVQKHVLAAWIKVWSLTKV